MRYAEWRRQRVSSNNNNSEPRSKKQYHRYSGILLYSTAFYFTSIRTRRSLLLYKGHTRQSSASSPLAVVTASFVRHFFLRRLFFFSLPLSLSSLLLSTLLHNFNATLHSLHSTCSTTCSTPPVPILLLLVTCSTAARLFPWLTLSAAPLSADFPLFAPRPERRTDSKFLPFIIFLSTHTLTLTTICFCNTKYQCPPFLLLFAFFAEPSPTIYCWHFGT